MEELPAEEPAQQAKEPFHSKSSAACQGAGRATAAGVNSDAPPAAAPGPLATARKAAKSKVKHLWRPLLDSPSGQPPPPQARAATARVDKRTPQRSEMSHDQVPRNQDMAAMYESTRDEPPTTLMIRNIPGKYTQCDLMQDLKDASFHGTYDFLYLPVDKGTGASVGYAFVNFVNAAVAADCIKSFDGYRFRRQLLRSNKLVKISVAHLQGLEKNYQHYKDTAVNAQKGGLGCPVIIANIVDFASGGEADYQPVHGHDSTAWSVPEFNDTPGVSSGVDWECPAVEVTPPIDYRNSLKEARSFFDSQFELLELKDPDHETADTREVTTLMICNIRGRQTIYEIIDAAYRHGFADTFNLVYMPSKYPKFTQNMGYAFVNFLRAEYATAFGKAFSDFRFPSYSSKKVSYTKPANHQGYEECIDRYKNQSSMGWLALWFGTDGWKVWNGGELQTACWYERTDE